MFVPGSILAENLPTYTFRTIEEYPHDPSAYTQGLVFEDDFLYESTGLRGESSLRIVNLEDGKVLQMKSIPEPFFAEGIALWKDKIYQLTWQEKTGFISSDENLEELARFYYPREGWGLTDDREKLVMSDGTDRLTFLDPISLEEIGYIRVSSGPFSVQSLNELEYISGEIWANIYQTACIARIDPKSGKVTGWIDLSGLLERDEMITAQVPNGIAFDEKSGQNLCDG